jgi:hypothetical protein
MAERQRCAVVSYGSGRAEAEVDAQRGEEGVVDVNDGRGARAKVGRDDLHEACEDDEVDRVLGEEVEKFALGVGFGIFGPGDVVKGLQVV